MNSRMIRPVLALTAAAGCLLAVVPLPAAGSVLAEPQADYKKLVDEKASAIVSIKFVMKGEQGEQEEETTGAIIESTGLILTSNLSFGGMASRMGGGGSPTPTDIKVLVGDDTQGVKAKIVARDTELGLAWVQTDDPPAKPYAYIDFSSGVDAKLGDNLYAVSLMGKFFDRAPWVAECKVGAIVKKPRNLIIPSMGLRGVELSMPVFDAQNRAVGVTTFILPEQEEMEANPGGMQTAMRGITSGMILPASEVIAATARAKETAKKGPPPEADKPKDAEKSDGEKPKSEEKPKADPK